MSPEPRRPRAIPNRECFRVNLRDGLRCRRCGRAPAAQAGYHRGFEYHHVRPFRDGGENVAENLALLCAGCHVEADREGFHPSPAALRVPERFACAACAASLETAQVEMNCGWYRCDACARTTHLFVHAGLAGPEAARAQPGGGTSAP